ncbi:MAG: DNA-binding protein [Betaproteobacteria bacterium]|nr:DNA-binding protein [Betaproteobacteria bacterium]
MLRTPEEVKATFKHKGISIAQWATANGYSTNLVFEVLSGRKKGDRGQSHKIAVALGLKEGEIVNDVAHALDRQAA